MTTSTTPTRCRSRQTTGSEQRAGRAISRRRATRLALVATTALTPFVAWAEALPTGGQVIQGAAQIAQPSSTQLNVNQSSQRAVINWDGFSVGQGNTVQFNQPGKNSAVLNRVTGPLSSRIDGSIRANGHVYLVNPRGVVVGPTGRVDAQGFVASSLNTDDEDFMRGRLLFEGNGASAGVANHGTITVGQGGMAALLGGKVENTGVITAPMGKIGFGAGEQATIDLTGDGFLQIALPSDTDDEVLIDQAGRVRADGGLVEMRAATARDAARRVVNLSGVTEARSVSGRNGRIVLGGGTGGTVRVTGQVSTAPRVSAQLVEVSPRPAERPNVEITGRNIELAGAAISADGIGGGGSIRIGGDFQGGPALPRAETVDVDASTVISADAIGTGDGGTIAIWSDASTVFLGTNSARGGEDGGDGGFVEVSGLASLTYAGFTDTRAPNGEFGTLVLDPTNFTVCPDSNPTCFGGSSIILESTVELGLSGAGFIIDTTSGDPDSGDIRILADIDWTAATDFQLEADNNIFIDESITGTNGGLIIDAGGVITTLPGANVAVDLFRLNSGIWAQSSSFNPSFSANDFQIGFDATFLRATGNGSVIDPYEVTDIFGLQGMGSELLQGDGTGIPNEQFDTGANFELGSDLDLSPTAAWNGGDGWAALGTFSTSDVAITFDGDGPTDAGFEISNLTVDTIDASGLFGFTDGAEIRDVLLTSVDVRYGAPTAVTGVGALVANAANTTISNVSVSGAITATATEGNTDVGGVVGVMSGGSLQDVSFDGQIVADAEFGDLSVGGIAGTIGGNMSAVEDLRVGQGDLPPPGGFNVLSAGGRGALEVGGVFGRVETSANPAMTGLVSGVTVLVDVLDDMGFGADIFAGGAIGAINSAGGPIEILGGNYTIDVEADGAFGESFADVNVGGLVGENLGGTVNVVGPHTVDVTVDATAILDLAVGGHTGSMGGSATLTSPSFEAVSGTVTTTSDLTQAVGGLVGQSFGIIAGVDADADLTVTASPPLDDSETIVGGLIGRNFGDVTDVVTGGDIDVSGQGEFAVGGLIGANGFTVVDAASAGGLGMQEINVGTSGAPVLTTSTEVGGFVGRNFGEISGAAGNVAINVFAENLDFDDEGLRLVGVGGFVGAAEGEIEDSFASGDIFVESIGLSATVGGFAGASNDLDTDASITNVDVTVQSNFDANVGGFIGTMAGDSPEISDAKASGTVTFEEIGPTPSSASPGLASIGGFVGDQFNGTIERASSEGTVTVFSDTIDVAVGGFAGESDATIIDVYSRSDARSLGSVGDTGSEFVGGLIGREGFGTVDNAVSAGAVVASGTGAGSLVGGAIAENLGGGVTSVFFDTTTSGLMTSDGGIGLTTAELQDTEGFQSLAATFDFTAVWAPGAVGFFYPQIYTIDPVIYAIPDDVTVAVGDTPPPFTGTVFGGPSLYVFDLPGDMLDTADVFNGLSIPGTDAGVYALTSPPSTALSDDGITYDVIYGTGVYTVTGLFLEITTLDQTKGFGQDPFALDETEGVGWEITGGTLQPGDSVDSVTLDSAGEVVTAPVGTYAIDAVEAIGTGLQNYVITFVELGELIVTQALVEIAVETLDQTKTYGDVFALNETEGVGWEVVGTNMFMPGDGITTIELDSIGEQISAGVGVYDIEAGEITGTGLSNYNIVVSEIGQLTVEPRAIDFTITTLDQSKVYGSDFALDNTQDIGWETSGGGFVNGDGVTGVGLASLGTPAIADAGDFAITVDTVSGPGVENYIFNVQETGVLTVNPAPLTVTTLNQEKVFGDDAFALDETEGFGWEVSSGTLFNGDQIDAIVLDSPGEAVDADVGEFPIAAGAVLGTDASNYDVTVIEDGVLNVLPQELVLTLTTLNQTKTYGDETFALAETEGLGFEITEGALVTGDSIDVLPLASAGEAVTADVGVYDIVQDGDPVGVGLENYLITISEVGQLTVEQLAIDLTITTLDQTKVYGSAFALDETEGVGWELTGTGAFLFDDELTDVSLASAGEAATASVGEFAVEVAALAGEGIDNYILSFANDGALDVTPAPLTITPNDRSKEEGDTLVFDGTEFSTAGLRNADTVDLIDLASDGAAAGAPIEGSPFAITGSNPQGSGLSNYDVEFEVGALTIVPEGTLPEPPDPPDTPDTEVPTGAPPAEDRPVIVPPTTPSLPDTGDATITGEGGSEAFLERRNRIGNGDDSSDAVDSGATEAPTTLGVAGSEQSIEVAESVLAIIDRASSELDATVSACRESDQTVTDFLGCVSEALDAYSATLDPSNLDLPQELAQVSAAIIVARQGVDAARARAASRLAGVTDPTVRRQIELDAVAEATNALQFAEAEVTKAIALIRADDPELASVYRAQADTVVAALNSVEVELQRAVGL